MNTAMTAIAAVALSGSVLARARPDFSGTWMETAAEGGSATVMIVLQDGNTMTVQTPPGHDRWVFTLDGTASRNAVTQRDGSIRESVTTARWDGDTLVIATPGRSNGDGPYVVTLTWTLNDGTLVEKATVITEAGVVLSDRARTYVH